MPEELATRDKVVGVKQTRRALDCGKAASVFLGSDADERLTEPLRAMCRTAGVPVNSDYTMAQLGRACAIAVGTAACAVLQK